MLKVLVDLDIYDNIDDDDLLQIDEVEVEMSDNTLDLSITELLVNKIKSKKHSIC
ncbi:9329_t:CDS:2 [Scutellospora calospora]|uniref:9329_t:CDS:1 n=1 Tax=Scutellospora calospora TaxID=85575 RepID=A0ACA9JWY0_9GLOM|nr:9329_t:CDS:2 [Scutellospora calospora]